MTKHRHTCKPKDWPATSNSQLRVVFIQPTVSVLSSQLSIQQWSLQPPSLYQTSQIWTLLLSLVANLLMQVSKLQPFPIQVCIWQDQLHNSISKKKNPSRDLMTHSWSARQPHALSSYFIVNALFIHFNIQPDKWSKLEVCKKKKPVLRKLSSSSVDVSICCVAIR